LEDKQLIIAIDGPSGAGKSTVGKNLAKRLGYLYIDTGAMYRAVALKMKEKTIEPKDEMALSQLVSSIHISFLTDGEESRILCDGEDITHAIRSPEISRFASEISKIRIVREALVWMQREMGKGGGVVLEGRDIGTVVFPDADLKFYLDADPEERGRRRYREFSEKGVEVDFKKTLKEVIERDRNDMSRSLSPLKRANDAIFIDSTCRSVEEIVEEMCRIAAEKRRWSETDYR
jgi:cytidylate kinase